MKENCMDETSRLQAPQAFSKLLFTVMRQINPALKKLELYEFRYALENMYPEGGWDAVQVQSRDQLENLVGNRAFYQGIQLRPRAGDRIVLDEQITRLNQVLFAGLVRGVYSVEWVNSRFYFDVRGFYFIPRTVYFTADVLAHFGGKPCLHFEPKQARFERLFDVGYRDFKSANAEIDRAFVESVKKIIRARGTPMLITIAGPTAAGKTEITERLMTAFGRTSAKTTTIEMDNFLIDRDLRDDKPMGRESSHFDLLLRSLEQIRQGQSIRIPRYDFVLATSSHDLNGSLKPGCNPITIEPADVIFVEGNFPFQMPEISSLIGIKVVYLTDDPVRLKRKWKRDIDYRKKYDPAYFRNRYFRTQFLRAEDIYRPLMAVCDMLVDTTGAALWATPSIAEIIGRAEGRIEDGDDDRKKAA
jgi:uridine kinase